MEQVKGETIEAGGLNKTPEFLTSTTNFAVKDRLFGSRSTNTDFILLKGTRDIEITIAAFSAGNSGYTRFTGQHGIDTAFIPFIFIYHYNTDAFVAVPEIFTSQVISNAYIDGPDFYIDVHNFDIDPITVTVRAFIYEKRK